MLRLSISSKLEFAVDAGRGDALRLKYHWRKEVVQRMNDNIAGSPFLGGGVADG